MKLDLLTNASVVDDAIRFVSGKSKDKEKIKPSDSGADEDQPEEEQEEEAGEINTNQVF